MLGKIPKCAQCSFSAFSCGNDNLFLRDIGDIASSKDTGDIGFIAKINLDFSELVFFYFFGKIRIGYETDFYKNTLDS